MLDKDVVFLWENVYLMLEIVDLLTVVESNCLNQLSDVTVLLVYVLSQILNDKNIPKLVNDPSNFSLSLSLFQFTLFSSNSNSTIPMNLLRSPDRCPTSSFRILFSSSRAFSNGDNLSEDTSNSSKSLSPLLEGLMIKSFWYTENPLPVKISSNYFTSLSS